MKGDETVVIDFLHRQNISETIITFRKPAMCQSSDEARNCSARCQHRTTLKRLVNKANLVHNFSQYVYLFSLHVPGDCVPIIRRNNCIYATRGICHSVWMTGMKFHPAYQTVIHTE